MKNFKLFRILLILLSSSSLLWAGFNEKFFEEIDKSGVELKKIPNSDKMIVKMFLNYSNTSQKEMKLFGDTSNFNLNFSIPNRWDVQSANINLTYTPSIALEPTRSFMSFSVNKKIVRQLKLLNNKFIDQGDIKIKNVPIPKQELKDYNELTIQVFQHYLKNGTENMSLAPEVWTQIDLENSYIEFEIIEKRIPEKISSIFEYILDQKNPLKSEINLVVPKKGISQDLLFNYSFIASVFGKYLKHKEVDFSITSEIDPMKDNVLVGTFDEVSEIITEFKPNLTKKLMGNINLITDFANSKKAIIVLSGENQKKLKNVLFSTISFQQNIYDGQFVEVRDVTLPSKSKPYSAPHFLPLEKKIYFKDLGYKTKTFQGFYSEPLNLEFYLYPDLFFPKKAEVDFNLEVFYPKVVKNDSVLNIFINDIYATQFNLIEEGNNKNILDYFANFSGATGSFETQLLEDGNNRLNLSFKMVPFIDSKYQAFNSENLKASISENSYFELPSANHWVKLPNLKYFGSTVYPYSIYPDLQDTAILLEQPSQTNLKALMQIMFYFGEILEYPPYYLEISQKITDSIKNKNLLIIGRTNNENINKNSPLKVEYNHIEKSSSLQKKFFSDFENINISNDEDLNKEVKNKNSKIVITESGDKNPYVILQMYQSPFNAEKSVISFFEDEELKDKAVLGEMMQKVLKPEFLTNFGGGLIFLRTIQKEKHNIIKMATFETDNIYFLGDLNLWDKSRFYISNNPILFIFVSFLILILLTYFVRKTLLLYKVRYHDDAD